MICETCGNEIRKIDDKATERQCGFCATVHSINSAPSNERSGCLKEKLVAVKIDSSHSHTGMSYTKLVGIDFCIADIVQGLQLANVTTTGCCCGHGKRNGEILLLDGRTLIVKYGGVRPCKA